MKLPAKCVAGLLPLLLSGCVHKSNQAQVQQPLAPPIVDTPPVKTPQPTDLPPPVVTPPQNTQTDTANNQNPPPPPPKPKHKKPAAKPADQTTANGQQPASTQPPATPTQQASNGTENPGVSAIGQLSTGDPADVRTETENSIAATERGLRDIGRKLSDQEEKTAEQITEFIKEARKALTTGDIDGAQTLANKAKVLLGELTK
jgi:outer membrane biosynthesis protein TonB